MVPKISCAPKKRLGSSRQATFRVALKECVWETWQIVHKAGAAVGEGAEAR